MGLTLPASVVGLPSLPHATLPDFSSKYPLLAEWFTASCFGDGSLKKPGRIAIGLMMGQVVVRLELPGTGLQLKACVPDPLLAFDALEGLLALSPVPFERNPFDREFAAAESKKQSKK